MVGLVSDVAWIPMARMNLKGDRLACTLDKFDILRVVRCACDAELYGVILNLICEKPIMSLGIAVSARVVVQRERT